MTTSYWHRDAKKDAYPSLTKDLETDILIIGGGITGFMTAWSLMQEGKNAVLIESDQIGSGVTGYTTAHLNVSVDTEYGAVARGHGQAAAQLMAEAVQLAIELVGQVDKAHQLEAHYTRVPAFIYAETPDQTRELQQELQAAREAGLQAQKVEGNADLPYATAMMVRFETNARFHPLKFIYNLAKALKDAGVQIHEHSRATDLKEKTDYVEVTLSTGDRIRAKQVVLATHSPVFMHPVHTRMAPYRSYAIAVRTKKPVPDALFYDMREPYHYIRKEEDDVVIVGGADHKPGQTDDETAHLLALKAWTEEHFGIAEYLDGWSGQVFEPADHLPFIGKSLAHKRVYYGTGYSGDGTLWGTFAGYLLADLLLGKTNKFAKLFDPARMNIKAEAADFIKDNLDVAKEFVLERFRSDTHDVKEIPKGEGRILRQGLQQYAVYRDEQGGLHVMDPTCRHLGCVVQWNTLERTWDCPCHGGRFQATGQQLEGPPASGLKQAKL